ncbi:cupin domain-containing protein [Rosenbergiella sp. S61]|uniref:Cupin domain-containing protein n=1 Tax=Rosenbergiella gaditana TaxID=2726987 RepID=A0ABS5SWK9_9GAMM|nr:cupin domain-containing protein [Rosenbergiella gaditana]MBT0723858.1 cupin domain-containing protein [Rosenbergiella gaditana]
MKMTSPSQFSRRNFCQLLLAASTMPLSSYAQSQSASPHVAIQPLSLTKVVNGVPNDKLPLLIYQQAVPASVSRADDYLSELFAKNGWPVQWRYQIFPFTHYHSNTHELLGVSQGNAKVQLGGETGPTVTVKQGDVILIPAGVGHKQLSASDDFQVLGAYPKGLSPDLYHDDPSKLAEAQQHIATITMPTTDPVTGKQGGILTLWKA